MSSGRFWNLAKRRLMSRPPPSGFGSRVSVTSPKVLAHALKFETPWLASRFGES